MIILTCFYPYAGAQDCSRTRIYIQQSRKVLTVRIVLLKQVRPVYTGLCDLLELAHWYVFLCFFAKNDTQ